MRTVAIGLLLWMAVPSFGEEPKPPTRTPEERELSKETVRLAREGLELDRQGKPAEAVKPLRQALEISRKLYPAARYPDGHTELATSLDNLGVVLSHAGQTDKAVEYCREALAMYRKVYPAATYPDGHPRLATCLNNLGSSLNELGQNRQGLSLLQEALAMYRMLYPVEKHPEGHPDLATCFNNLAGAYESLGQWEMAADSRRECLQAMRRLFPPRKYPEGHPLLAVTLNNFASALDRTGQAEQAIAVYQESVDMCQKLYPVDRYPDGHPHLAAVISNLGSLYLSMGQTEKAASSYERSLEMTRRLYPAAKYPNGHPNLSRSLNNLGEAWNQMGRFDKAAICFRQCLEMDRKLFPISKYPDGHPKLASTLNNIAGILQKLGDGTGALSHYQQSLEMKRRLYPAANYPEGHIDVARSLSNLGHLHEAAGQAEKAAAYFQQSLDIIRRLYPVSAYPEGHPSLALVLFNLGYAHSAMGAFEKAEALMRQSLDMKVRLYPVSQYPEGHPDLARGLCNLGIILSALGRSDEAAGLQARSLDMHQRLMKREMLVATEAAAFDKVTSQSFYRDAFLSTTRSRATIADQIYPAVARSSALVMRLLDQRHASLRAAGTAAGEKLTELRANRRRTDRLLQDSRLERTERDRLLAESAEKREKLERELAVAIPTLKRWQALDQLGPTDLINALPPGAVFVDLIRHVNFDTEGGKPRHVPCYVAFVLTKGQPIRRVELGQAAPIDAAVLAWRSTIESRRDLRSALVSVPLFGPQRVGGFADDVAKRVWQPLAGAIPTGITTLYVAADGDLARLPWAALPVSGGRVLLEEMAVAHVPHSTFLLDHLTHPRRFVGSESLFAVGDLDYGASGWPALPGAAAELNALSARAAGERCITSGRAATPALLIESLPKARYAHFATHGEFKADDLANERRHAAVAALTAGDIPRIAAKNPLGYVGLVLSGGEVVSGLSIVDLDLENLRLVTLSACETGLGEFTAGEGVQGLQRAFHLAGCPNVVASLWKINDSATAALMAKFYHEMWVNKKAPLEALRSAQLTIYHHPEMIPELAGERGAPKLAAALKGEPRASATGARDPKTPVAEVPGAPRRADTKLWAAFVLSGVGK